MINNAISMAAIAYGLALADKRKFGRRPGHDWIAGYCAGKMRMALMILKNGMPTSRAERLIIGTKIRYGLRGDQ